MFSAPKRDVTLTVNWASWIFLFVGGALVLDFWNPSHLEDTEQTLAGLVLFLFSSNITFTTEHTNPGPWLLGTTFALMFASITVVAIGLLKLVVGS